MDARPLVVVELERPWTVLAGLMTLDDIAYDEGGIVQPIPAARRTLGSLDVPGSAAYRAAACMVSIARVEGTLGSSPRRLKDLLLAPYQRSPLERWVGMVFVYTPETSPIERTRD